MKKRINRKEFLNFLLKETALKKIKQTEFTGKNIYFLTDDNESIEHFQIEFIPQSKLYNYTILLRGIIKEAEYLHNKCVKYLRRLELNRNIVFDTELTTTHI